MTVISMQKKEQAMEKRACILLVEEVQIRFKSTEMSKIVTDKVCLSSTKKESLYKIKEKQLEPSLIFQ